MSAAAEDPEAAGPEAAGPETTGQETTGQETTGPAVAGPAAALPAAAGPQPPQSSADAVVTAVLAANAAHYAAFESADLDLMGAVWLDDAEVSCVHPGWLPIRGRSAVLRSYAAIMAGTAYIQFFLTDVAVDVVGDTAVLTCTENILSAGDGMPETSFTGAKAVATNVFRRTPSGWRLWSHHGSPVAPQDHDDESAGGPQDE